MKIFKSLDFEVSKKRIEPNTPGEYLVHLEDYESLNDLIRRSVRTSSKFDVPSSETGEFDDAFTIDEEKPQTYNNIDKLISSQDTKEELKVPNAERSEGQGTANSSEVAAEEMQ